MVDFCKRNLHHVKNLTIQKGEYVGSLPPKERNHDFVYKSPSFSPKTFVVTKDFNHYSPSLL